MEVLALPKPSKILFDKESLKFNLSDFHLKNERARKKVVFKLFLCVKYYLISMHINAWKSFGSMEKTKHSKVI